MLEHEVQGRSTDVGERLIDMFLDGEEGGRFLKYDKNPTNSTPDEHRTRARSPTDGTVGIHKYFLELELSGALYLIQNTTYALRERTP